MRNTEVLNTNENNWELEIVCDSKEKRDSIIKELIQFKFVNFEVEKVDITKLHTSNEDVWTIFIYTMGFNILQDVASAIKKYDDKRL